MYEESKYLGYFETLRQGGNLTAEAKAEIDAERERLGIKKPCGRCRNKMADVVMLIVNHHRTKVSAPVQPLQGWWLKPGTDVYVNGRRLNSETLTEELAEWCEKIEISHKILHRIN